MLSSGISKRVARCAAVALAAACSVRHSGSFGLGPGLGTGAGTGVGAGAWAGAGTGKYEIRTFHHCKHPFCPLRQVPGNENTQDVVKTALGLSAPLQFVYFTNGAMQILP
jgi:hypothetical protein